MKSFDIPVALMFFKRFDKITQIIERISAVKPKKMYLLSDYGRNEEEIQQVEKTRRVVEASINWDCELIKFYHTENVGVYGNIAMGAIKIFQQEEKCIFLEDDNLPDTGFFSYCETMLERYEDNEKVLWVCGTNYLSKQKMDKLRAKGKVGNYDAFFTQLMLPCGWASWSGKFLKYYDPEMKIYNGKQSLEKIEPTYVFKPLFESEKINFLRTAQELITDKKRVSWDRQIGFSIRYHNLYGIMPFYNQINNIGDENESTHRKSNIFDKAMMNRFLNIPTCTIRKDRKFNVSENVNPVLEKEMSKRMLLPLWLRFLVKIYSKIKK